ncbi:Cyst wall protein, type 1B [Carpediemonas membranifera]|uniref:Cyst wall protein, type 1B n=1 Tax=Carpediemonas membranifera TaxID=201153 RepID=A0A8J6E1Z3_9EUKA|nr:Cyst wall protein, type 1B [Carpediemonas membranifera]|eukprot:KAG9394058.1 Cyst wall protein, type 1B [Carpediemonas membranifera]
MKFGTSLVVLGLIATVFAQCVISEQEALMNLYTALGGDFWTDNSGWNTGDVCTWYGIGCNLDGYVTDIRLPANNLTGELTSDIGCFPLPQEPPAQRERDLRPRPRRYRLPDQPQVPQPRQQPPVWSPPRRPLQRRVPPVHLPRPQPLRGRDPRLLRHQLHLRQGDPPRLQPAHRRPPRLLRLRVHVRAPLPLQQLQRRVPRLD